MLLKRRGMDRLKHQRVIAVKHRRSRETRAGRQKKAPRPGVRKPGSSGPKQRFKPSPVYAGGRGIEGEKVGPAGKKGEKNPTSRGGIVFL